MQLQISKNFMLFPVSPTAAEKRLRFLAGGKLIFDLSIRAEAGGEWLYSYDVSRFLGQTVELSFDPEISLLPELSDLPAPLPEAAERYRPKLHFTAPSGWLNDPNGLVYFRDRYHMFYQHNPVGPVWGNMHWGHAVSQDLVTWEHRPIALFPDELGTMFSGSAIVDSENVSGLGTKDTPALLLFYTAAGGTSVLSGEKKYCQCLAYSLDGEHFTKYDKNPVLPHVVGQNRDPKVVYCPATGEYVMALYLEGCSYALFGSTDLLSWRELCRIDLPGDAECPDFHPLTAPDGRELWVLSGAAGKYVVGEFDGHSFRPVTPVRTFTGEGNLSYAAQTFSGDPAGRIIRMAWDRSHIPNSPFQSAMTVPTELKLCEYHGELWLRAIPLPGFDKAPFAALSAGEYREARLDFAEGAVLVDLTGRASKAFTLSLCGLLLHIDPEKNMLRVGDRRHLPLFSEEGAFRLCLICDRTSTEVWTGDGLGTLCIPHVADPGLTRLELRAPDGVHIQALTLSNLTNQEAKA